MDGKRALTGPHNSKRLALSVSALRCPTCREPLTACFNDDSHVAWAECFADDHHFVQNIFTPSERGSNHDYTFIGEPE